MKKVQTRGGLKHRVVSLFTEPMRRGEGYWRLGLGYTVSNLADMLNVNPETVEEVLMTLRQRDDLELIEFGNVCFPSDFEKLGKLNKDILKSCFFPQKMQ